MMPFAEIMKKKMKQAALFALLLCFAITLMPKDIFASGLTIAVLKTEGNFPIEDILSGFKSGMQQSNIPIRLVSIEVAHDAEKISGQLSGIKPDLILCIGVKALERAAAIDKIPKVYVMVTAENTRPWQDRMDICGVALDIAPAQQFRIMHQAMPERKHIGVLYDPELNDKLIEEARKAASAAGYTLIAQPVKSARDIPLALQKIENHIDILWTIYDQTAYSSETTRYLLLQTLRKKIPMVGLSHHFAKAGALLAIYGDYPDMGRQLALQAIAISRKPEQANPMMRPRKVRIAINEKVGSLLNITFSDQFIKTVDQTY